MSKSSTASSAKNPSSQLPTKSAWARGPPLSTSQSSPRSQSPAPTTPVSATPTHSRRPSTLGQSVSIKDGVSLPRNTAGAAKTGSSVSFGFGSIDDTSASIASPSSAATSAAAPAAAGVKSEGVKSFGSVPATVGNPVNGKSSVTTKPSSLQSTPSASAATNTSSTSGPSTPTTPAARVKVDVRKLFQNPSSTPPSQTPSDTSSPSVRPTNLPSQQPSQPHLPSQPIPPSGSSQIHPYPYGPQNGPRNQPQNGPAQPPRSPGYRPQMPNGNPRPPTGNGPPGPNQIPGSPRIPPPPHPNAPNQMPPQMPPPIPGWPGYYYPPIGPEQYMYPPWGGYQMPPQHAGMPPQPQMHHPPPPGHGQPPPPHPGMPMSPRNPPQHLQGPPGTPTPQHANAVPHQPHPPAPVSHPSNNNIGGITSPPPTPSVSSPTVGGQRPLNTGASAFVPGGRKVKITTAEGAEVSLDKFKHQHTPSTGSITSPPGSNATSLTASPNRKGIKIENPKDKEVERKKKEAEEKAKKEAEEKARKEKEAAEKKKKEEEEAKRKEEEKKKKEEEEKKKKEEEEERKKKEEEEQRIKKELEEKRKKEEEEERLRKEEEERKKKAEEERVRLAEEQRKKEEEEKEKERIKAEEEERAKKEAEEKERLHKEAEAAKVLAETAKTTTEKEEGEIDEDAPKAEEKKALKIQTSLEGPSGRKRPGPLDLSGAQKPNIPQPLPSALATARIIDDLGRVPYPEGVKSPKVELNVNAKNGKFRYDRDFLLQFMSICKEKPDSLPPLDAIGLEPTDASTFGLSRGGSGRHRINSGSTPARQASLSGLGFGSGSGFGKSGPGSSFGGMGNFATPNSAKLTSEERFALANGGRSASVGGPGGLPFARPGQMQRTASQGGPGGSMDSRRTRSKRGDKRPDANKQPQQHGGSAFGGGYPNAGPPLEPVAPLQATENRWDRNALSSAAADSPEVVDRKVKALLNKITMEKFDSISDQIIAWANKSEKEKDGRTLIQVIRLVFEKATDEATFSEMYARLCRKMMEQISPQVQDDGIKNAEGKPIAGGQLFRKYLLNRCQEDFERGWVAKEAAAAAAAAKSAEDKAKADENEKKEGEDGEVALYSDEYYAAQKAKRQGLGLIRFIGELFKLQMLTERIMHECVKKLLGNVENPEEEEIESLCKLLTTVGQILDTPKARAHMDVYFSRMKELTKSPNVSSRMQFMLQDVIELRERKWASRNTVSAPTTIKQVHEQAAKAEQASKEAHGNRNLPMSRTGSRRGTERPDPANPEGWAVAGGGGSVRVTGKAGDLSKFGQISNKGAPMTFGPSSVFNKKETKRESLSRSNSSANMFQMLQTDAAAEASTSKGSRPPSRKASVDLTHGMATSDAPPQRRKLVLQPRTKPLEDANRANDSDNESEEETEEPEAEMSDADAKKKIEEDSKEFFAVRNLDEAEVYFEKLPSQHHTKLVDKLLSHALESKEADAQLVSDLLQRASSKSLASSAALEEAFSSLAEFLDDIVYDAPKAPNLFALMLKGAGFSDEQRTRITSKSEGSGQKVLELSS